MSSTKPVINKLSYLWAAIIALGNVRPNNLEELIVTIILFFMCLFAFNMVTIDEHVENKSRKTKLTIGGTFIGFVIGTLIGLSISVNHQNEMGNIVVTSSTIGATLGFFLSRVIKA